MHHAKTWRRKILENIKETPELTGGKKEEKRRGKSTCWASGWSGRVRGAGTRLRAMSYTSKMHVFHAYPESLARDVAWLMSSGAESLVNEHLIGLMNAERDCRNYCTYLPNLRFSPPFALGHLPQDQCRRQVQFSTNLKIKQKAETKREDPVEETLRSQPFRAPRVSIYFKFFAYCKFIYLSNNAFIIPTLKSEYLWTLIKSFAARNCLPF